MVVSSRSGKDEVRPTENQSFSVRRQARKGFILMEKWAGGGWFDVSLCFGRGGDSGAVVKREEVDARIWWAHVTSSRGALGRLILGEKLAKGLLGGCWRLKLVSEKGLFSASI